jgi:hypothetical protein
LAHSNTKLATSISAKTIGNGDELDDDDRLPYSSSSQTHIDRNLYSDMDATSFSNLTINKASGNLDASLRTISDRYSIKSSATSGISTQHVSSTMSMPMNNVETKKKGGVRKLIRKIFQPTLDTNKQQTNHTSVSLNPTKSSKSNIVDARHVGAAAADSSRITQGPIRLLVLRHGERLDRYYSSQWLRQAFDKDGNFCRFSPILP